MRGSRGGPSTVLSGVVACCLHLNPCVSLAQGPDTTTATVRAVIGADGMYSTVRSSVQVRNGNSALNLHAERRVERGWRVTFEHRMGGAGGRRH
jgi:2-polyprenyl-6-methoxyphenol hydroxylase-like FAD-dependent oxidoreductase